MEKKFLFLLKSHLKKKFIKKHKNFIKFKGNNFEVYALGNNINLKTFKMKKSKLKNLALSKKTVSSLTTKVLGGAAASSKSFRLADCPAPVTQRQTCQYSCEKKSCYCMD